MRLLASLLLFHFLSSMASAQSKESIFSCDDFFYGKAGGWPLARLLNNPEHDALFFIHDSGVSNKGRHWKLPRARVENSKQWDSLFKKFGLNIYRLGDSILSGRILLASMDVGLPGYTPRQNPTLPNMTSSPSQTRIRVETEEVNIEDWVIESGQLESMSGLNSAIQKIVFRGTAHRHSPWARPNSPSDQAAMEITIETAQRDLARLTVTVSPKTGPIIRYQQTVRYDLHLADGTISAK